MNYSEETTKYMVEKYKASPERETVEDLAKELSKSIKSIIGKLSEKEFIDVRSTKLRLENFLLRKWRSFLISLMVWESKWRVYLVWRKLQKQRSRNSK